MSLAYFPTAEGYYDYRNNKYIYQYKDHLGNVRLSYAKNPDTGSIEVLDRNDYYAFGMNMYEQNSVYDAMGTPLNNKYNQKELQETGFYDYGWRQYMPDLGRWFGMDQLSEIYDSTSPYAYVMNNPVMLTDPDGRKIKPTKDGWEFTGEDIADVYGYLTNGGSSSMLVSGLSAWGEMRTGQDFWSFLNSWKPSGNSGVGGSIYTTTVSDGPITGNANEIQGIVWTKTKITKVFSNHEILKETQASWRKGGGVMMMGGDMFGISDIFGIMLAEAKPKNRYLALALGAAVIIGTKFRAADDVLKGELAAEKGILSAGDALRIENAATRINKPITVVGSRANGTAGAYSDWDYIIEGGINSREWSKIKNSLPGAKSVIDNTPRNIDIMIGPAWPGYPSITITPR